MINSGREDSQQDWGNEEHLPVIPDKDYFKIGEVCDITGVKQHVLRYWESEFRILSPQRARSKQRLYRRADVESVLAIKRLLKDQGFTISGAKKAMARERGQHSPARSADELFRDIKQELQDLKKILEE